MSIEKIAGYVGNTVSNFVSTAVQREGDEIGTALQSALAGGTDKFVANISNSIDDKMTSQLVDEGSLSFRKLLDGIMDTLPFKSRKQKTSKVASTINAHQG